jgi:hypothetical protein
MQKRARIVVIIGSVLVVLIAALAILPMLFSGQISTRAKAAANSSLNARVDWQDAGLSLFGDFPNLTLTLDRLSVAGMQKFAGDTLAKIGELAVTLDLGSVIGYVRHDAPIVVRSVRLDRPIVALKVLEDGSANWNISKPSSGPTKSSPISVSLEQLEIRDARVSYDDLQAKTVASVVGYRQSLSGDFGQDAFLLQTNAHADSVSLRFGGIPYLAHVALDVRADVDADMKQRRFTFRKNEIKLNDLALAFSGSTTFGGDRTAIDVSFNTPRTEFKHILSLVPAIYAKDFAKVRTSGALTLAGNVKGDYGKTAFPSFAVNAKVADGAFQYPDLPLPARGIVLDLAVRNPGGNVDSTVVQLNRFHAVIGSEPLDGALTLRTPVSDPDVDLRLTGKLDLADVQKTVKLTNVNELAGKIAADIAVRTRLSYLDNKQYDRVAARGTIDVQNLVVKSADLPRALAIQEASLQLSPQRAELESLTGQIGSSDVKLAGALENVVPFALRGDPLRGTATFTSRHFNLDEWQSDDALEVIPVPGNIDFGLQANIGELTLGKLMMTDVRGGVRVKDRRATLDHLTMNTLGGQIAVTGFYETTDLAKPTFDTNVSLESVDIPSAATALVTVQTLAPVARFARGTVSSELHLAGALGKNMLPVFNVLDGKGSLRTSELLLQGLPALGKVADAVKIERLRSPTFDSLRASIQIQGGRVQVNPFTVRVGQTSLRISGSHGIDQSMQYTLGLRVPRSELGAQANQVVASLASRAGKTGINLQAADTVGLEIKLGGTLTNPTVQTNLGDIVASAGQNVKQAAQQALSDRVDSAKARADSAALEARRKAQAEADKLVADAEARATQVRDEASKLAETVRREGAARADSLVAKANSPLAKVAARPAADQLRKQSNDRADQLIREANKRADDLVNEAKKKAALIAPPAGG